MIKRPYSSRNEIVGTTNRSIAAMPSAWSRRKVFQPWDGGPLRLAIYLATLVCPISMPSLRSSPWIRGAPHSGLARLISRISRRISTPNNRPTTTASRLPAPVGSEPGTMPADKGVRLDDRQRIANFSEQPIETNEYHSVDGAEGEFLWSSSPQNVDLLPQRPNLCLKHYPRPDQIDNHPTNEPAKIPDCARSSSDSRSTAKQDKVCDRDSAVRATMLTCNSCNCSSRPITPKRPSNQRPALFTNRSIC